MHVKFMYKCRIKLNWPEYSSLYGKPSRPQRADKILWHLLHDPQDSVKIFRHIDIRIYFQVRKRFVTGCIGIEISIRLIDGLNLSTGQRKIIK